MLTLAVAASIAISQAGAVTISAPKVSQGLRPNAFAAAPTGARVAAAMEDRSIRIIDASTRLTLKTLSGHPQTPYAIAWSPNGKVIASGDESGRVFFWDVATWKKTREVRTHTRGVQFLTFDASGKTLLSTGKDDTIRFYEVATGKELKTLYGKGANFYGARFVGDAIVVATLSDGVRIYSKYQMARKFGAHPDKAVWDVDVSAGRAASGGRDGVVGIYEYKSGQKVQLLRGHLDWVVHTEFSPNGRLLATSSSDGSMRVWDMKGFKLLTTFEQQSTIGAPIVWTADGKYLLGAGADDFLHIFSVNPPQK